MSNIIKLAPYAYLAKRNGSNMHDLLLLVPVDTSGDTDLSNVSATKSGTRVSINYVTNSNSTNVPYRFKHFEIDSEGRYVDIEIKGDNNADRAILLEFGDADTEPATVSNQIQTCAPYLFSKIETVGNLKYIQPSCIILFDGGLGVQSETIIFASDSCVPTISLGNNNATTDPTMFVINQNVKAILTPNQEYTFEGNVAGNSSYNKPPRKHKTRLIWA
ncbi:MAG: hypothetical protein H7246_06300 [Phycisphaerae bacterium]|nr:hypothetical protein [Saprospiraceae bacterium]